MSDDDTVPAPAGVPFDRLTVPTRAQAQAIWNATPKPSFRKVATLMQQRGFQISPKTLDRWLKADWQEPAKPELPPVSRDKTTRKARKAATRLLDHEALKSDPLVITAREALLAEEEFARSKLDDLRGDDLSREKLKEVLDKSLMAASVMMIEAIMRKRDLLAGMPKDVGSFFKDVAELSKGMAVGNDIPKFADGEAGDKARLINGEVEPEANPVAAKIKAFKNKHGLRAV